MADVNQLITLGIGTPSDIEHLTLFGLGADSSAPSTPSGTGGLTVITAQRQGTIQGEVTAVITAERNKQVNNG